MARIFFAAIVLLFFTDSAASQQPPPMLAHTIHLTDGRTITLTLPSPLTIGIAAQGLRRVRFFSESPDHRIFVTDMYNRADNSLGRIYVLDGWDEATHSFAQTVPYLDHLRNPNSIAFYTEPARTGSRAQAWLYVALTDRLVRYKYAQGDNAPTGPPELLARYPDFGLNYKYGGWHLTRSIAFATFRGQTMLYVSIGSSCDACREKEPVRASLQRMDPDGRNVEIVARGLRNAVGLRYFKALDGGSLFATNMGADHLGDAEPEDTFFELDSEDHEGPIASAHTAKPPAPGVNPLAVSDVTIPPADFGWPTCYFADGRPYPDTLISAPKPTDHIFPPPPAGPRPPQVDCRRVPAAYTTFAAHSSPLGLEYFDSANPFLNGSFLIALHGAGHPKIGTGYRVVRFTARSRKPEDFITGFLVTQAGKPVVTGRPCGLLRTGPDTFLLTDDLDGIVYSIHPR